MRLSDFEIGTHYDGVTRARTGWRNVFLREELCDMLHDQEELEAVNAEHKIVSQPEAQRVWAVPNLEFTEWCKEQGIRISLDVLWRDGCSVWINCTDTERLAVMKLTFGFKSGEM